MVYRIVFYLFVCVSVLCCFGCGEPVAPPVVSEEVAAEVDALNAKAVRDNVERDVSEDEYEVKVADVGATGKGNYGVTSEEPTSIVTVPISTYFHAQEAAVFKIQIPSAMNLFQASEGRFPNSEEEFMQQIVRANQIVLPKLPEGDSYFYDVQSHTLMIKTKK